MAIFDPELFSADTRMELAFLKASDECEKKQARRFGRAPRKKAQSGRIIRPYVNDVFLLPRAADVQPRQRKK
jgi:hypothetical protein